MEAILNNPQLNEQQLDMIRLLKKPMPEQYFSELKHLAVRLLNKQLDDTLESWEKEKNITEEDYERLSQGHYRTPYKKA